ncbi:hypothetical protein [Actinomadura madurae]|uniref:hypothetical protein n=1 Tax=Actinomadura madurae TaxID=1993 RepID=UPI002025DD4F|nr:hypothetical protein [Actinomadura madurae]MCP9953678.1 hypothetical protein [Actinomadura madurae]MCP9970434.1 hypothetical protein [Actinomadura madurae]MCP9982915.1 hypothetical protein [Actinomadura madurae]MCQ0005536.1 hypothetical protein [Actinomadura madurae]URM99166.1 hypothetical protein LUW76_35250 [Actinomadura madurae]
MNDELDALLRDHYRAAADEIHADPETVRRFQDAGRETAPAWRARLRRWAFPAVAAAVTAAVVVAVAVLLWPGAGRPEPARPLTPPGTTSTPAEHPRTPEPAPSATTVPTPNPASPGRPVPPSPSGPSGPGGAGSPASPGVGEPSAREPSATPVVPPPAGVTDGPGA